jgi:hypothetical protein
MSFVRSDSASVDTAATLAADAALLLASDLRARGGCERLLLADQEARLETPSTFGREGIGPAQGCS